MLKSCILHEPKYNLTLHVSGWERAGEEREKEPQTETDFKISIPAKQYTFYK